MRHYLHKHKLGIALFFAFILSVAWITAQIGGTSGTASVSGTGILHKSVQGVASLPERGVTALVDALGRFWDGYVDLTDKAVQNRLLLQDIHRLETELNRQREIVAENDRLRELLRMRGTWAAVPLSASVTGRNPSNWFNTLTIDRGANDGIHKDMAVLSDTGVVGRVVSALPASSRVQLLTDPASAVAVIVQRTRENCIVKGKVGSSCEVRYLPQDADLMEGDILITSGLDGIYPKGIAVARITSIDRYGNGQFLAAGAEPIAGVRRLEEVLLVPGGRE